MVNAAELSGQASDVEALVTDFLLDPARLSLELPHMTTGQRKHVKRVVEQHPELKCESYGFGQDRKLHLFKKSVRPNTANAVVQNQVVHARGWASDVVASAVSIKNTFICDFVGSESDDAAPQPIVFRSLPPALSQSTLHACMEEGNNEMDKRSDCSTATPSVGHSDGSPAPSSRSTSSREVLSLPPGLPPLPGLEVRNTFVHFDGPSMDERAVQSMPHSMFSRSFWAEAMEKQTPGVPLVTPACGPVAADCLLAPGTEVVIHGLLKAPTFNGLTGTVDSFDKESCRYSILLTSTAAGHKWAKIKGENLQQVFVPPPPCFAPTLAPAECQTASGDLYNLPSTPTWEDHVPMETLKLMASV